MKKPRHTSLAMLMAYLVFTVECIFVEVMGYGVIQVSDARTSWGEILEILIFSPVAFFFYLFIPLLPFLKLSQWWLFIFLFTLNILVQHYVLKLKFNWFIIGLNLSVWITFSMWVALNILISA